MKILVVNAGSSSLKYQLFDMDTGHVLAKGNCERIGAGGAVSGGDVYYAYFAPRPALYLKSSILVSVETEDEGKALADYSDTDLIDELYRRRRSTYDPD